MRVLTLDKENFKEKCLELRRNFESRWGKPDMTVGIATGGEYVARIFSDVPEPLAIVERRRAGSELKDRHATDILKRLPSKANDLLRIVESGLYNLKWIASGKKDVIPRAFELPEEIVRKIKRLPTGATIALVDDAADSGETLASVKESILLVAPHVNIITAVLTVTRRQADPVVDLALWQDGTLIRFPWSADYNR